jgi:hypothetical protein
MALRESWQKFKSRFGKRPPVIHTEWGDVTEGCRKQAAMNFRDDPEKRAKAIEMIGIDECKRRYPEADWDA